MKKINFEILEKKELEQQWKEFDNQAKRLREIKDEQEKELRIKIDLLNSQRNAIERETWEKIDRLREYDFREAVKWKVAAERKEKFDKAISEAKGKYGEQFDFNVDDKGTIFAVLDEKEDIYAIFGTDWYFSNYRIDVVKTKVTDDKEEVLFRISVDDNSKTLKEEIEQIVETMKNYDSLLETAIEDYKKSRGFFNKVLKLEKKDKKIGFVVENKFGDDKPFFIVETTESEISSKYVVEDGKTNYDKHIYIVKLRYMFNKTYTTEKKALSKLQELMN